VYRIWVLSAIAALGQTFEGELQPLATVRHPVRLEAGQFAIARAHQVQGDFVLYLDKVKVARSEGGGNEHAAWIAERSREYVITLEGAVAGPARYRLEIESRTPTEADRSLAAAFRLIFVDAPALAAKQTAAATREQIAVLNRAVELAKAAGDVPFEGYAHRRLSRALNILGDKKASQAADARAMELLEPLAAERYGWVAAMVDRGTSMALSGELEAGVELLERAIVICRAEGFPSRELTALNGLGLAASSRGEFRKAVGYYEKILPMLEPLGMRDDVPIALFNLANASANAGDTQRAIELFGRVLQMRKERGDDRGTARTMSNLGQILISLNEAGKGESYLKQAGELFRKVGDRVGEGGVRVAFGEALLRQSRPVEAAAEFERAVALYRESGMKTNVASTLAPLAEMYTHTGEWDKARAAAGEALALHKSSGVGVSMSRIYTSLARVAEHDRRNDEALGYFELAFAAARKNSEREGEARTYSMRSAFHKRQGSFELALADIERSIAVSDLAAARITNPATRASFRSSRAKRDDDHLELLVTMHDREPTAGYAARAYLVTERTRARSLGEFLGSRAESKPAAKDEAALLAAVTSAQSNLFRPGVPAAQRKRLESDLSRAERDLDLLQRAEGRHANEGLYEAWDEERTRTELAGKDGAVITYALGPARSVAWVITAAGTQVVSLPPRAEVLQHVDAFRRLASKPVSALTAAREQAAVSAAGAQLHRLLIAPLEKALTGKRSLVIVPDGALSYVPFEAIGGLIETHRIAYAPSASIAGALRKPAASAERTLLAMGDPLLPGAAAMAPVLERGYSFAPLPNARAEVQSIGRLFPGGTTFLGERASEERMKKEELSSYRYLHFAAHGYFDGANPARSGIVLAPGGSDDGFLQAREISKFDLRADLVTLSACQSGLGRVLDGEGVQGLSRAFFLAGARSVVVSLWNVNDAAASELMRRFYSGLKAGLPKDEALRAAKLALRKEPRWRHPYYWAPFVLQGDPGSK